jgi:hypothetical protein
MMYDAYRRQLWTSKAGAVEKTLEAVCGKSGEHVVGCRAQVLYAIEKYRG